MPLATHVQNRYSTQRLVSLTNPDDQDATSIDSTVLGHAVDDAVADMATVAGLTYDDTDNQHIVAAIPGVILHLQTRLSRVSEVNFTPWYDRLKALALVTSRDRVEPVTDSELTPSNRSDNETSPIRPLLDPEIWQEHRPDSV